MTVVWIIFEVYSETSENIIYLPWNKGNIYFIWECPNSSQGTSKVSIFFPKNSFQEGCIFLALPRTKLSSVRNLRAKVYFKDILNLCPNRSIILEKFQWLNWRNVHKEIKNWSCYSKFCLLNALLIKMGLYKSQSMFFMSPHRVNCWWGRKPWSSYYS